MYHAKSTTQAAIDNALGFRSIVISSSNFEAHGEIRTRYTAKRPKGKKFYHLIMFPNGEVVAC